MDIQELKQFESVYQPSKKIAYCWGVKKYVQLCLEEDHTDIVGHANDSLRIWQAAKAQAVQECKWTQNEDGYFDASCGQSFVFSEPEDKPSKHKFTHCCFCGGKLVEAQEPAND